MSLLWGVLKWTSLNKSAVLVTRFRFPLHMLECKMTAWLPPTYHETARTFIKSCCTSPHSMTKLTLNEQAILDINSEWILVLVGNQLPNPKDNSPSPVFGSTHWSGQIVFAGPAVKTDQRLVTRYQKAVNRQLRILTNVHPWNLSLHDKYDLIEKPTFAEIDGTTPFHLACSNCLLRLLMPLRTAMI